MAGRERWKTATAGTVEKPEREREKYRHTHSLRSTDHKASDRSGHYSWEACWELGRPASDPQDTDTAGDRKPESGYGFSRILGTETATLPPSAYSDLVCV